MLRPRTLCLVLLAACAPRRAAPPAPVAIRADAGPPEPVAPLVMVKAPGPTPMELKQLTEEEWARGVRDKLSVKLKVDPAELRFSPGKQLVAFVRQPTPKRFQIEVVDPEGKRRARFRPVTAPRSQEPPKDFRFLTEDRLVYEVALPPPAPMQPPTRLMVIQPLKKRAIRCAGTRFTFTSKQDRLAFVSLNAGKPEATFVAVDGVQVYPRRGRTVIGSNLAWSKDGVSLAFLETKPATPARLILLADYDNPSGDTNWDLPPTASLDGARVFWSGPGKLVVGKTVTRPTFAASFVKEQ